MYKFYVYDPNLTGDYNQWIGPNRKDTLLQKIDRLTKKQLPLLHTKETAHRLADLNCKSTDFKQKVCYKANLFLPKNPSSKNYQLLDINKECIVGFWISFKAFKESEYGNATFYSPTKQFWPVDPSKNKNWLNYSTILPEIQEFIRQKRSPLVWMKLENSFERFFIVWW